jgi:hypothetical protein
MGTTGIWADAISFSLPENGVLGSDRVVEEGVDIASRGRAIDIQSAGNHHSRFQVASLATRSRTVSPWHSTLLKTKMRPSQFQVSFIH